MCVLKNTVTQSFFNSRIRSFTILRPSGSSQLIGSSRNTIFGLLIIAWASQILCNIHLEYFASNLSAAS